MPLAEQVGDLFDAVQPALAHGCNCSGVMGKGIALEFKRRWPDMYLAYRLACQNDQFHPGDVFTWITTDRVIFNLATQRTWRSPATIDAVVESVTRMCDEAIDLGINSIAIPRIGAGLGALDWAEVHAALIRAVKPPILLTAYSPQ